MVELACTNEQKIPLVATITTAAGNPAEVDGPLRITVVSGNGTFIQDPLTPLAFEVVSGDDPGDTTYLVEADADLDVNGVELIADTVLLRVSGARAANLGLLAGTAVPK